METKQPFEHVVREHGPVVLRVCRAVLGVDEAEDAWSETFIAALKAYPELPPGANIEAWLVTIAHRKSLDLIRARNRRPSVVEELPARASVLGIPGDGQSDVLDAVGQLPPKQRQVIAYHYLAGLPYKDIALLLGGTADAARRAGADGIRNLRAVLAVVPEAVVKGETP
ncbi:RNA polymerase sigma factor [Arthrobacter sp. ISL-30]|uniref:RNA polymerase sigma factor n=1 Tax=Arthrobacter sp. ISL-30 TaxID=2819109 RepID=UPI001BE6D9E2|nr:RNA polymerase sigma factor [Arthrobacter sp. ISL-30]MBT2514887.1 RNA polymerase sigma factor [Arthrobacter sp. ISL-30]